MTLQEEINNLTWQNAINKLKSILKKLLPQEAKYKVYSALFTQAGTDAPTATILENTLGNIVWTRSEQGVYLGTLSGVFAEDKIFSPQEATTNYTDESGFSYILFIRRISDDIISVSARENTELIIPIDDALSQKPIEIRVYN